MRVFCYDADKKETIRLSSINNNYDGTNKYTFIISDDQYKRLCCYDNITYYETEKSNIYMINIYKHKLYKFLPNVGDKIIFRYKIKNNKVVISFGNLFARSTLDLWDGEK